MLVVWFSHTFIFLPCVACGTWDLLHVLDAVGPTSTFHYRKSMPVCLCCAGRLPTTQICNCSWPRKLNYLEVMLHTSSQPRAAHSQRLTNTGMKELGSLLKVDTSVVIFMLQSFLWEQTKGRLWLSLHLGFSFPILPSLSSRFYLRACPWCIA